MFIQNKYYTWYCNIIQTAQNRPKLTGYFENHHVIPRSLGGTDNLENIVSLTAREHFISHILLTKFTSSDNHHKMLYAVNMMSNLNPLDKGDFTGQELEDIAVEHPEWYEQLVLNPFHTRFPGGECYGDLTSRLESVVMDIEQQVGPVLVVSHISILQVLVAYFRATPVEDCTSIALPMNTVIKFTPSKGGGWQESRACAVTSSSGSHCDLQSMDDTLHWEHRTPVGMSMKRHVMRKESPPEDVGTWSVPSTQALPIWGDHFRSSSSPV
jgi:broad specificity phosphatase PhoE